MSQIKLWVVEDDKPGYLTLSLALSEEGYEVVCFGSVKDASNGTQADRGKAAILDLRLPGISGREVLEELKESYPDTQVVMISATGSERARKEDREIGVLGIFAKPLSIAELTRMIHELPR